ncbi:hypothetical protein KVR01_011417 [Diaporthe batatas]|uniref:uncharacterized protein n=1 Tax=Diaporthe batatas TaxID=748121 RepID=UPI001D03DE7A|nr:uncharacterized protein KVR01_011417 [Diaporthe batatas]KAG8158974.1 hypothetical protein KVR01_011417 [Diaporthe batatas]
MRSGGFQVCCQCDYPLSFATMTASREPSTPDLQPRPPVTGYHGKLSVPVKKTSSGLQSSATWTSNSGDYMSDTDEIANRDDFVQEYNRLAKKHGVRPLVPDPPEISEFDGIAPRRNWWSRTFRRTSSQSTEHSVKRKRSVGHVTAHMMHPKRDSLKDQDLQGLVRLCGKSFLYLPPEYAPGSLVLPTCFRATAQHLVHSGSIRVVNELYEFYCAHQAGGDVANTVRSPNLPLHINAGIHDVASLFKKFLAGLPGGILGSLSLFDALVAINSQLYTDPEFSRTKQSKLRARLIALAVGTLRSQYRRELICAVFGLLCLLGRAAETAPREDDTGRPLPTSDLMGYSALGIVFGPLLIGDMLGSHSVKLADPSSGLFLVPVSPQPKSKKEKKKAKEQPEEPPQPFWDVDKIHVVNDITEMLITNWRDVVKQMRNMDGNLSILRRRSRASISDDSRLVKNFTRTPEDGFAHHRSVDIETSEDRPPSPIASSSRAVSFKQTDRTSEALSVKKTRQTPARSPSNYTRGPNLGLLSPPREEPSSEDQEITTTTPLKSSLRSPTKSTTQSQKTSGPENHENIPPSSEGEVTTIQQVCISSAPAKSLERTRPEAEATRIEYLESGKTERDKTTHEANVSTPQRREHSRTPSKVPKPKNHEDLGVDSVKNLKPKFSCDLDSMTACTVVPGAKILSGTSTMHYRPKTSYTDSTTESTNVGSASRSIRSTQGKEHQNTQRLAIGSAHIVTPDQMDGAVDVALTRNLCRGSFRDLKDQFEARNNGVNRPSSYPIWKSRSRIDLPLHNDANAHHQTPSLDTPRKGSPVSAFGSRDDLKRGAGKVLGLAAKFDSAAKTSRFVPVGEGGECKYRREAAGLVSPYTSNPSPTHSITTTSTPASLMCRSRDPMVLPSNVENSRKSKIPRPQHADSGGRSAREFGPEPARTGTGSTPSHPERSMLLTPSKPPIKEVSEATVVSLAQLDGSPRDCLSKIPRPAPTLSPGHELTPVAYHSSPIMPTATTSSNSGLPRLSQYSMTPSSGEPLSYIQKTSLHNLSFSPSNGLGRGRNASSLRDQIRSLRQELSAKNEECVQLRLDFEERRKASEVNEILLREDLEGAKADLAKWKRRAEKAEDKVERLESTARRLHSGGRNHDFSFVSGLPDAIDISERAPQYQTLSPRMNQSARRAPENIRPTGPPFLMGGDAMSDCSGSTVVRNIRGAEEGHWAPFDEQVGIPAPIPMDEFL